MWRPRPLTPVWWLVYQSNQVHGIHGGMLEIRHAVLRCRAIYPGDAIEKAVGYGWTHRPGGYPFLHAVRTADSSSHPQ